MRDWYGYTGPLVEQDPEPEPVQIPWSLILEHWADIECDLHEKFNIDAESGILRQRTWRWLHLRITDLTRQPSRLKQVCDAYALEVSQ